MATVDIYNVAGEKTGTVDLPESVFSIEVNPEVVQLVVEAQQANAFIPYAHTKGRAEVRGGGKKPWKQKGTGNARHGSIRSPLWKGGGITFGPTKFRNMEKKVNKKTRRKAICMALSDKASSERLIVIDSFDGLTGKTKEFVNLIEKLPLQKKSVLVAQSKNNELVTRSTKNVPKSAVLLADSINVKDILTHQYLLIDKSAIDVFVERFTT